MSHYSRNSSDKIVDVLVENVLTGEEIYSFVLPKTLIPKIKVGMRVFIPFGRGNKLRKGVVVSIRDGEGKGFKEVIGLVNPFRIIDEDGIKVLLEINKNYFIPVFKFLKTLIPVGKGRGGREIVRIIDDKWREKLTKREKKKREIMHFIEENGGEVDLSIVKRYFSLNTINNLIKRGMIEKIVLLSKERAVLTKERLKRKIKIKEEKDILDVKDGKILLISGYTYRERWNFYKNSIINCIKRNKKIKLIFPERIDCEEFFNFLPKELKVFGEVLTGKTNKSDRYRIYRRIEEKNINFIVGTYFSLFLPLEEERIVVDKGEYFPLMEDLISKEFETIVLRYGEIGKKQVVFGSFVPSLPLYYLSKKMGWEIISEEIKFPKVKIISNPHGVTITESVDRIIRRNRQRKIFLFLPRKGYFSFLYCSDCGYVERCPKCKVPLTYFKEKDKLVCKVCGYERKPFDVCPVCSGISMRFAIPGTERIKDILSKRLKNRKILELDESVVKRSKGLRKSIEKEFVEKGDIIIGTQMIFPLLRKIKDFIFIFLDMDFILNFPEYDASEKVFYTIIKVVEEARIANGKIFIQTRTPENAIFRSLVTKRPEEFIKREFFIRKEARYPPYVKYIKLKGVNEGIYKKIKRISNEGDSLYYNNKDEIIIKTKDILKFREVFDKIRKEAIIEIKEF